MAGGVGDAPHGLFEVVKYRAMLFGMLCAQQDCPAALSGNSTNAGTCAWHVRAWPAHGLTCYRRDFLFLSLQIDKSQHTASHTATRLSQAGHSLTLSLFMLHGFCKGDMKSHLPPYTKKTA
jgi:hypothetical protein